MDYVIAPMMYFDKLLNFSVSKFYPWFSDHCPLLYTLTLNEGVNSQVGEIEPLAELPARHFWTNKIIKSLKMHCNLYLQETRSIVF